MKLYWVGYSQAY